MKKNTHPDFSRLSPPSRGSIFSSRRDSNASTIGSGGAAGNPIPIGPPATDPTGSIHNLQLDIMDDIVQARKARMKLWNTSNEKVCEVQTVDEAGTSSPKRYTNRRYSDFVGSTLAPIPSNRRASENMLSPAVAALAANETLQQNSGSTSGAGGGLSTGTSMAANFFKKSGIVVTKNDLMSLMSSLTSSATEINYMHDEPVPEPLAGFALKTSRNTTGTTVTAVTTTAAAATSATTPATTSNSLKPDAAGVPRSGRSNSFDVSILHNCKQIITGTTGAASGGAAAGGDRNAAALSGWFEKRHTPMARKASLRPTCEATVNFSKDMIERLRSGDKSGSSGSGTGTDKAAGNEKAGGGTTSGSATPSTSGGAVGAPPKKSRSKLRWDNKSSFVDPHIIGNAIEGFLRKSGTGGRSTRESRARKAAGPTSSSFWFGKADEDDTKDTCDSSLCATLKDLFVK